MCQTFLFMNNGLLTRRMSEALQTEAPACVAGHGQSACIGVPGAPEGLDDKYDAIYKFYSDSEKVSPCVSEAGETLSSVSQFGCCVDASKNDRVASVDPLYIGKDALESGEIPC